MNKRTLKSVTTALLGVLVVLQIFQLSAAFAECDVTTGVCSGDPMRGWLTIQQRLNALDASNAAKSGNAWAPTTNGGVTYSDNIPADVSQNLSKQNETSAAEIAKGNADYKASLEAANQGKTLDSSEKTTSTPVQTLSDSQMDAISSLKPGETLTVTDENGNTSTFVWKETDGAGAAANTSGTDGAGVAKESDSSSSNGADRPTEVFVTEKIPGADCEEAPKFQAGPKTQVYKCYVSGGFSVFIGITASLIKYATYISALVGVLMVVAYGIAYMFGDGEFKKEMQKRVQQVVIGLTTLFLVAFILNTIAPWIYSS